jgi:DNA-binding IclR family transcriptional regulator
MEMGAAMNAALIILGDKLGLYKAMAGPGPLTSAQVAQKTNLNERYVREWLSAQAAGGFLTYDPAAQTFRFLQSKLSLSQWKTARFSFLDFSSSSRR